MNLESRFFYRLVKVLYFTSLVLFSSVLFLILYLVKPAKVIDNNKSNIVCVDGRSYSFPTVGIEMESYEKKLDETKHATAKQFCFNTSLKPVTDPKVIAELNKAEKEGHAFFPEIEKNGSAPIISDAIYTLNVVYKPRDWSSFSESIFRCLLAFAIFYGIANILREALVYLAFGKALTWNWLLRFRSSKLWKSLLAFVGFPRRAI